jgi:hypothetical protein
MNGASPPEPQPPPLVPAPTQAPAPPNARPPTDAPKCALCALEISQGNLLLLCQGAPNQPCLQIVHQSCGYKADGLQGDPSSAAIWCPLCTQLHPHQGTLQGPGSGGLDMAAGLRVQPTVEEAPRQAGACHAWQLKLLQIIPTGTSHH